jgi:hypothetical protein
MDEKKENSGALVTTVLYPACGSFISFFSSPIVQIQQNYVL